VLISLSVGFLIGWIYRTPETVERVQTGVVVGAVAIEDVQYRLPPLPECAGFDFDPKIGGMSGAELVSYTARLYYWAAGCSNALVVTQELFNENHD
jgi:hypothetical protein